MGKPNINASMIVKESEFVVPKMLQKRKKNKIVHDLQELLPGELDQSKAAVKSTGLMVLKLHSVVGFHVRPLYIRAQFLGPIQSHKYRPMGVPSWSNWAVTWAKGLYIEARPNFPISYMASYMAGFWRERIGPMPKTFRKNWAHAKNF